MFKAIKDFEDLLENPPEDERLLEIIRNPGLYCLVEGLDSRAHSLILDSLFGYKSFEIENILTAGHKEKWPLGNYKSWWKQTADGNQTWIGLDWQLLQTPYCDLKEIFDLIQFRPGELVVDLGCGYGRFGLVLNFLSPETRFMGFEFVPERFKEGKRIFDKFTCENAKLFCQDIILEDFIMPDADYYFIYDYGHEEHIRKTLNALSDKCNGKPFKVIAWGKLARHVIDLENPWLSQVYPPRHENNFSIYSMSED